MVAALLLLGLSTEAVDCHNWTPLLCAAHSQNLSVEQLPVQYRIVRMLCWAGADSNARTSSGSTALHLLARYPHSEEQLEAMRTLLLCGADINIRGHHEYTALHEACEHRVLETVEFLVRNGADITLTDKSQRTPLHVAAISGDAETLRMLVERAGGRLDLTSAQGSVRDLALFCNHMDVVDLIDNELSELKPADLTRFREERPLTSSGKIARRSSEPMAGAARFAHECELLLGADLIAKVTTARERQLELAAQLGLSMSPRGGASVLSAESTHQEVTTPALAAGSASSSSLTPHAAATASPSPTAVATASTTVNKTPLDTAKQPAELSRISSKMKMMGGSMLGKLLVEPGAAAAPPSSESTASESSVAVASSSSSSSGEARNSVSPRHASKALDPAEAASAGDSALASLRRKTRAKAKLYTTKFLRTKELSEFLKLEEKRESSEQSRTKRTDSTVSASASFAADLAQSIDAQTLRFTLLSDPRDTVSGLMLKDRSQASEWSSVRASISMASTKASQFSDEEESDTEVYDEVYDTDSGDECATNDLDQHLQMSRVRSTFQPAELIEAMATYRRTTSQTKISRTRSKMKEPAGVSKKPKDELPLAISTPLWVVESGAFSKQLLTRELQFEYSSMDDFFYHRHFLKEGFRNEEQRNAVDEAALHFRSHVNLFGEVDGRTVIVSLSRVSDSSNGLKILIRTHEEDIQAWISNETLSITRPGMKAKIRPLLDVFQTKFSYIQQLIPNTDRKLSLALLKFERSTKALAHKFGILYAKKGQDPEEVLANNMPDRTTDDPAANRFLQFLEFLGEKIKLRGWSKYRGELDTKEDLNGEHSIYTEFEARCMMFQVLPWFRGVERRWPKAGNDLVLLIYQESGQFIAPLLPSQLVHSYLVVQPVVGSSPQQFRVTMCLARGMSRVRPAIPQENVFELNDRFRQFLYFKLINAERAAQHCRRPVGSGRQPLPDLIRRSRQVHLDMIRSEILGE
mmetsp:Transcript_3577/g.8622  ORF Transcript_3577/g.8622 Transcript_3577/m.8622 type:complete len:982 (+) Transcript_3577:92-3037(+)